MGASAPYITMKITLKHITYGVVFVLIAALTFQSYRLSVKMAKLNEANSSLAIVNERLIHKQDSINLLRKQSLLLKFKADSLGLLVADLQNDNDSLNNELDSVLSAIDSIPPKDSYTFLQDSAYNYPGELEYPFNAKQVTEIHRTYVENIMVKKINVNLATTIYVLQEQNKTQDSLISNQYVQLSIYSDMINSLRGVIVTQEAENNTLNKQLSKERKLKILFQGATAVGVVFILITLL